MMFLIIGLAVIVVGGFGIGWMISWVADRRKDGEDIGI